MHKEHVGEELVGDRRLKLPTCHIDFKVLFTVKTNRTCILRASFLMFHPLKKVQKYNNLPKIPCASNFPSSSQHSGFADMESQTALSALSTGLGNFTFPCPLCPSVHTYIEFFPSKTVLILWLPGAYPHTVFWENFCEKSTVVLGACLHQWGFWVMLYIYPLKSTQYAESMSEQRVSTNCCVLLSTNYPDCNCCLILWSMCLSFWFLYFTCLLDLQLESDYNYFDLVLISAICPVVNCLHWGGPMQSLPFLCERARLKIWNSLDSPDGGGGGSVSPFQAL